MQERIIYSTEWPWANPLEIILAMGGWSVQDALSDRNVAREVSTLWELRREAQKLRAAHRESHDADLFRWWRRQDCSVPCSTCGESKGNCSCR